MGRRSDHSREELQELLLHHGHALMGEAGYARFSGREVAKRAGYTVGTIYNVFGSLDGLLAAINGRTVDHWADQLEARLAEDGPDRISSVVAGYFEFALANAECWSAIYEHRPQGAMTMPEQYHLGRQRLVTIVEREVAAVLPQSTTVDIPSFARSLIATVHGHCSYVVSGTFALLGETDPVGTALARVRESIQAQS